MHCELRRGQASIPQQLIKSEPQAGAVAAVIVDFAVYPFDTLKTRVQSPDYEKLYKDHRTGTLKRNVLFKGLYQGVWSVVVSTIPACKSPTTGALKGDDALKDDDALKSDDALKGDEILKRGKQELSS